MFPLNDFNFVCCALATVSAAVGYGVARRRRSLSVQRSTDSKTMIVPRREQSSSLFSSTESETSTEPPSSDYPTPSEKATDDTEPGTLKRKCRDETPQADVDRTNGDQETKAETIQVDVAPPRKKCRTPPSESVDAVAETDDHVDHDPVIKTEPESPRAVVSPADVVAEPIAEDVVMEAPHPSEIKPIPETPTTPSKDVPEAPTASSKDVPETPTASSKVNSIASLTSLDGTPAIINTNVFAGFKPTPTPTPFALPTTTIPAAKHSSAFQAFSGSQSAFALAQTRTDTPSFRSAPVWSTLSSSSHAHSMSASGDSETPDVVDSVSDGKGKANASSSSSSSDHKALFLGPSRSADPLAAHFYEKSTFNAVTGEEDEEIRAELKGAKLFIKRGAREFTDGIIGHIKLLSKSDKDLTQQRILFRRESVWKVSMNTKLSSEVRCALDEEQGVLRVTFKEAVEKESLPKDQWPQEVVVYALKKGKASKADFFQFARSVVDWRTPSKPAVEPVEQVKSEEV